MAKQKNKKNAKAAAVKAAAASKAATEKTRKVISGVVASLAKAKPGPSIYAPKGSTLQQRRKVARDTGRIRWADLGRKKRSLTNPHKYDAPWSSDKSNWWARQGTSSVMINLNFALKPQRTRHVCEHPSRLVATHAWQSTLHPSTVLRAVVPLTASLPSSCQLLL